MFTGLIESVAKVVSVEEGNRSRRLTIRDERVTADVAVGDSIAVDGVCLTVVEVFGDRLTVDVGAETLRRTTLGGLAAGAQVDIERAVRADQRLGGHLVQGHVDGIGTIVKIEPEGDTRWMEVAVPPRLQRYLAEKGSVAVDGVSLTVAHLAADRFSVSLIPHTLAATTLGEKGAGDSVNIEVDILAKYVERSVSAHLEERRRIDEAAV